MPELVCAADDPRWLDERRKGVTATDIAAITGLSPYESEYSLYWKKLGQVPDEHTDSPRLRLGRDLEPIIVDRWQEDHPGQVLDSNQAALWRSSTRPWQLATPDRVTISYEIERDTNGTIPIDLDAVLEVKSWADADRDRWADGPPARVRAQVLWQMDTLDVARGHVGVLFLPSGDFRSYVIEHANEDKCWEMVHPKWCLACADIMLLRVAGEEFMARLHGQLPPPSPDASSATLAALKARFRDPLPGKEAEIDAGLWNDWEGWKARENEAERECKSFENLIREQAGEAKHLTVGGVKVATRVVSDSNVQAHTRHVDYYRRVKNGDPE